MNDKQLQIGCVYTPVEQAVVFFERYQIFEQWMNGARVFDPTMGSGNLLEALIVMGIDRNYRIDQMPLTGLFGNELNSEQYKKTLLYFQERYGVDMSSQFTNEDIFMLSPKFYDIVIGNPPWCNFTDLPTEYKKRLKKRFIEFDLVSDSKKLLWGGSRIDIAALVIQKILRDFLVDKGMCYCFAPLSLFLNDGAHQAFRSYSVGDVLFSPLEIYDLQGIDVFSGIGTRHCFVVFQRDVAWSRSVPYFVFEDQRWVSYRAAPLFLDNHPLSVGTEEELASLRENLFIEVPKSTKPRQGLNTSGCNSLFFFTCCVQVDDEYVLLGEKLITPKKWVYPLMVGANFQEEKMKAQKWVLLLHDPVTGKPLSSDTLRAEQQLWEYLKSHEHTLRKRKGVMIQSMIHKGFWWSLLGVGLYSFAPYKIIWQASGKSTFRPKIISGRWQANQSLQAFMPIQTLSLAKEIYKQLLSRHVELYLLSMKMKGTQSWAQPGKMKKLLSFVDGE